MQVTRDQYLRECKRRFGVSNPERHHIATWEMVVRSGADPYWVRKQLAAPPNYDGARGEGPDWCFRRFGMTRTEMGDGRTICIGGEHEDWYDPDFCIYNDVIVLRTPPGEISPETRSSGVEIYGYPESEFPPTDFHSATLSGDRIIVIGRLGYHQDRSPSLTPVYALDTQSYEMREVRASGSPPGWVHEHHASFDPRANAITVRGGKLLADAEREAVRNHTAFRRHLEEMRWEQVAQSEPHRRFVSERSEDGDDNGLSPPAECFRPSRTPHVWLGMEDRGVETYMLDVGGARVTLMDLYSDVRMLLEGELPPEVLSALQVEFRERLQSATGVPWTCTEAALEADG